MATDHAAFVLRDGEFWLPPQFLSDDEPRIQPPVPSCGAAGGRFFPPVDYGNGCGHSTLTSPGDSVVGSADVSDNEEDFISDLTRKVAQSTLEDDFAPLHSKVLPLHGFGFRFCCFSFFL
ncbi:hypothetical protein MLD38_029845 [Melastoma candidum]|uniref:Uncharacterized protein n=1 Tax=Melastoma candidum TaxID=119954 RepID=A0ACB9N7D7_9MYRT|nr:hypothetical protein MLD38_029845 [Melastoma candidum]